MNLVFMGTPDFAAVILKRLLDWDGCTVAAVYTQPDRPSGRGLACAPTPVKALAQERGVPVFQPPNFKDPAEVAALAALAPDVLVVAAYGLILPQAVLDVPRLMPVNVHASLLPKYRGAAPIQRCLLAGDHATGATIMRMEAGLDSGPILLQRALAVRPFDTAETLHDELAEQGADLLVEALTRLKEGRLVEKPQDHSLATLAPKLTKEDGLLDFSRPAAEVHNRVRAMHPWPGAHFFWQRPNGKKIRLVLAPGRFEETDPGAPPGALLGERDGLLAIACADGLYLTPQVTPEGKKPQDAKAFACGYLDSCR